MNRGMLVGLVVLAIAALGIALLFPVVVKNGLIARDEAADEAWAQIATQLQRRADLVPNLVATVKGYAAHEQEIFVSLAEARAGLLAAKGPADAARASAALDLGLGRLLAIAENYPQLKADAAFVRLQDELAGTENRIAVARTRFNQAVKAYNAAIRKFPGSLFAPGMELGRRDYYEPPDAAAAQAVPAVAF